MDNKICFKCNENKHISHYYKHPKTADRHLNKCKSCTKNDTAINTSIRQLDQEWVFQEKERNRLKYHRLEYKGLHNQSPEKKAESMRDYEDKYPEKKKVHSLSNNLRSSIKGNQLHHWSYNEIHAKDVIELTLKDHYTLHRYINYDQETKFYKFNRILLDSKEKMIYVIKLLEIIIYN